MFLPISSNLKAFSALRFSQARFILPFCAVMAFLCFSSLIAKAQTADMPNEGNVTEQAKNIDNVEALLKEPVAGAGTRNMQETVGKVHWSLEKQGEDGEPVVKGIVDFPDINFSINIIFRRNLADDLAASHIFTLTFLDSSKEQTRIVRDFAGIELRLSPQAQGRFLKGLSIPVDSGIYAIALFKTDFDIKLNTELLKENQWFTFPALFENGRTGFLFFAKGKEGKKVFDEAFALWAKLK